MADSVKMIADMVAVIEGLPKTAQGDAKVSDPASLAVAFVGIAAPEYQVDVDALTERATTAETSERMASDELDALRSRVDQVNAAVASAIAQLQTGDPDGALLLLNGIAQ